MPIPAIREISAAIMDQSINTDMCLSLSLDMRGNHDNLISRPCHAPQEMNMFAIVRRGALDGLSLFHSSDLSEGNPGVLSLSPVCRLNLSIDSSPDRLKPCLVPSEPP